MQSTVDRASTHTGRFVTVTATYSARGFKLNPGETIDCGFSEFSRDGRDPLLIGVQAGQKLEALTTSEDGKIYACALRDAVPYAVMLTPGSWQ